MKQNNTKTKPQKHKQTATTKKQTHIKQKTKQDHTIKHEKHMTNKKTQ